MEIIVKQKNFWSDRDEDVLRAIREGYVNTHYAMWRELDKWPRTASGLPSTAGTTASIAFIRKGKIYIGHVGDSAIILGYQTEGENQWRAKALTKDHKPESGPEMMRIQDAGGKVVSKSGVPRVVWNRPRIGHKGPVRRSTHMDEIPFLAVARSLGDLWSYNSELDTFVVSPEPDVKVIPVDVKSHRCLIFGTDGLWNMLSPQAAVAIVQATDRHNEKHLIASQQTGNEVLFNTKKDRVIHHGTYMPTASTMPGNVEEEEEDNSKVLNACEPVPPPIASTHPEVDAKLPDSSNGNDDIVAPSLQPETIPSPEKSVEKSTSFYIDNSTKLQETRAADKNNTAEVADVVESIQVDEVSSSEILEEGAEMEKKGTDEAVVAKLTNLKDEKQATSERDGTEEKHDNTLITSQIKQLDKEFLSETGVPNATPQTELSSANEDVQPDGTLIGSKLRRSGGILAENNSCNDDEARNDVLSRQRHKQPQQHPLFPAATPDVRSIKRRHSLNSQSRNAYADVAPTDPKSYVSIKSRYKVPITKSSGNVTNEENALKKSAPSRQTSGGNAAAVVGNKRRHSAIAQAVDGGCGIQQQQQEPCAKRRTRSEDRPSLTDENDPANKVTEDASSRLSWPTSDSALSKNNGTAATLSGQDRLSSSNTFQRRSLGKKATLVKTIRRPSMSGSNRLQQLRGSFGLRDWDQGRSNRTNNCNDRRLNRTVALMSPTDTTMPQRWLRSDTMAATPVKTLRSRNVDIAGHTISAQMVHQYGVVKQNRLPMPNKLKQSTNSGSLQSSRVRSSSLSSNKLKQANSNGGSVSTCAAINNATTGCSSTSGIAKRVKSPYNPSARSLNTRSRIKRLGK
ncbi:Protein phosphatase 1D [Harpegnathos saltator]|uniref:Protein phosphatase 1D n=1 Tax=Harpegnathos saltator TaxID=610380 RepID=E2BDQ3_HARSA|nr:Protein phosphatase 1D [Harpegnathos saltator]